MDLYTDITLECSKLVTKRYSTSFSLGIQLFDKSYHKAIYAIYGFVRFADEIVDTFHEQDQGTLLARFTRDTWDAIERKFSSNPILHSFQWVVNEYNIDRHLIEAFLASMEMDLVKKDYSPEEFKKYVYGSAEVVGLMCLRIFYPDDDSKYKELTPAARKLGEAFQKVNFLRDIRDDFENKGRSYFPGTDVETFITHRKQEIEQDIREDFNEAVKGIRQLKKSARTGVYLAYRFYLELLKKISRTPAEEVLSRRYRVSNRQKLWLLVKVILRNRFDRIK